MDGSAEQCLERLQDFVGSLCFCPCCEESEQCLEDCTFAVDAPKDYEFMCKARKALFGADGAPQQ